MLDNLNENFELAAERTREDYERASEEAKIEYQKILADYSESISQEMEEKGATITDLNNSIEVLKKKINAINEANKRLEEENNKIDFYKLQVSTEDLEEIAKLREIGKILRDNTPLNKLIWTYYFRTAYNELCGRAIGGETKTGIYKITNLLDGKSYIGQATNIKDRWSTHIKTGLGAEMPTRNKLYPAMLKDGVENFTFEVLEECLATELNEREKFYIDFYDTLNYGYNSTRGGS